MMRAARDLWPDALEGLGARQLIGFTRCRDCEDAGGRVITWRSDDDVMIEHPYIPGTWVAYGSTPLCLLHALQRQRDSWAAV